MKSYYYLDYLHREIFLEEEDIQAVPESGRADEACSAIAGSAAPQAKAAASSSAVSVVLPIPGRGRVSAILENTAAGWGNRRSSPRQ